MAADSVDQLPFDDELRALTTGKQIVIASNRGPVEYHQGPNGKLTTRRGPGGMVTALAALARDLPLTWVALAMTDGDREAFPTREAPARQAKLGQQELRVRYVPVTQEQYRYHYDEISNNVLWFLQHYLWDAANTPNFTQQEYTYWDEGYRWVNLAIADTIADEALAQTRKPRQRGRRDGSDTIVLLQDYHLYLAARAVRSRLPRATVQQFIHIPWPAVRYWEFLPERFVLEIYEGLAANDVLGFQTEQDVRNFLFCAQQFLAGSRVDFSRGTIMWRRHRLLARAYPVPVDADEVRGALASPAGQRGSEEIAKLVQEDARVLVRVDRLDPTKNVVRGFRAFELLLERFPELRGTVQFFAFLVPSRQTLGKYRRYDREVQALIKHINDTYGTPDWQPITYYFENNRPRALAAMQRYDVLFVNPIIDGMNLVAKEGPAVNERDGVIVLTRTAGAYHQLAEAVLPATATDIEEMTDQLYEALTMQPHERAERAQIAREVVDRESPAKWVLAQLRDAAAVHPALRRPGSSAPATPSLSEVG